VAGAQTDTGKNPGGGRQGKLLRQKRKEKKPQLFKVARTPLQGGKKLFQKKRSEQLSRLYSKRSEKLYVEGFPSKKEVTAPPSGPERYKGR